MKRTDICQCQEFVSDLNLGTRKMEEWSSIKCRNHVCVCRLPVSPKNGDIIDQCKAAYHTCICDQKVMRGYALSEGNFSCRAHDWEDGSMSAPEVDSCRQILTEYSQRIPIMKPPRRRSKQ